MTQDSSKTTDRIDFIDTRKIVTGVVSRAVDAVLAPLEEGLRKKIAGTRNSSDVLLADYLVKKHDHLRSVKSLVYVGQPGDILQLYVPCTFLHNGTTITENDFIDTLHVSPKRVIQGTAGMGKSFFMRHAYVTEFRSGRIGFPLYLDLRNLNGSKLSILNFILGEISQSDRYFMKEQLQLGIKSGLFTLMLDGLDELNPVRLRSVQNELAELALSNDKAKIIVSSRPMDGPSSWNRFWTYELAPLDYKRSRDVIRRSGIAVSVAESFEKALTPQFFIKHREFLQSPLLVIIMALVFRDNTDISSSLATFYEDAYAALINRHDATKEYKRSFHCGLERSQFRSVLNLLCAKTYGRYLYEFREDELLKNIGEAVAGRQFAAKSEALLTDLITSVCLITSDGFKLRFSHRSFQEYFCSCFICTVDGATARKLLSKVGLRHDSVGVLSLVREMNRDLYEAEWLEPTINGILATRLDVRLIQLLDINVDGRDGTHHISPSQGLGGVYRRILELENIGVANAVTGLAQAVARLFEDMYNEDVKREGLVPPSPFRNPSGIEFKKIASQDENVKRILLELYQPLADCLAAVIKRRQDREVAMGKLFEV